MTRKLTKVKVTHVSYVDKAANQHTFFLTKSAEGATPVFNHDVHTLTKADDPQKLVYGIVYAPDVEDSQGDYMDAADIEKAAHGFMESYQQIDKQHDFTTHAGKVVESYIAPVDMTVGEETITKGTWVLVTKATDEIWEAIQKGEFTGYSLAGQAECIQKATASNYAARLPKEQIDLACSALHQAVDQINWGGDDLPTQLQKILAEADEFKGVVQSIGTGTVPAPSPTPATSVATEKSAGGIVDKVKKLFKKEEDPKMDMEAIKKAVGEVIKPLSDKVEALEKAAAPAEPAKPAEPTEEENIKKAVSEAVKPLNDRIESLEKARKSNNPGNIEVAKAAEGNDVPSYVDAAFPMPKN